MAKSMRRRCDAKLPFREVAQDRAIRAGELAKFLRRSRRCKKWALRGSRRCRLHGGLSTGPTTPEGMARTLAAMQAGRLRWLARLKAEGKPAPCGRKKGGRNLPADEREQIAYEKDCHRFARKMHRQSRAKEKARRLESRRRRKEHARRQARAAAGLGYWTEEEWENL
jgi:hypothetical protein